MNYDKINNNIFNQVEIFENDKMIVLTTFKIAHSWCRDKFLKSENINSSFQIDMSSLSFELKQYNKQNDEYYKKINSIWNSLLEKKEKRGYMPRY